MSADAEGMTMEAAGSLVAFDLIDALDLGVVIVDELLVIQRWNRWMADASGRAADDVVGTPVTSVFPDLRPSVVEALRDAVAGKLVLMSQSLHRYSLPLPAPAGHEDFDRMQQTTRVVPISSASGARSVAIFVQDVTERVARERQLREATESAQLANRAKSDFLATMSHELRTPIGAMTGYVDLILEEIHGPVTDVQRSHLGRVKAVGGHLLQIVEEILLFARVEAGREELHIQQVDSVKIARDVIGVMEPVANRKGLALTFHAPASARLIETDPVKVRQILINLLGNAVKFTKEGSISVSVNDTADGGVAFAVADTGSGIPAADLPRIFEPFTQLPNVYTRSDSGTGLGLPVSRRLARMLGGDLTVTSRLGEGSTFTAIIPARPTESNPSRAGSA